jgi:XTP/dITP diphosphohydrolase
VSAHLQPATDGASGRLRLVLASANPDKVAEIQVIVAEAAGDRVELVPRPSQVPDVEETGATLHDNARLKALTLCQATGLPAVADDTGLEVDALDGAPGVYSARFSGPDATYTTNVAKLLDELQRRGALDPSRRRARFRTVALACWPDGSELVAEGALDGTIAAGPRGQAGFGYDPVFIPDEGDGRTLAQMSAQEKHAVSHRGRAFRALAAGLASSAAGRLR